MNVTHFARVDTSLNPYLLLYRRALEGQGIRVHLERELDLRWFLSHGRSCDAIHLHWIEAAYKPRPLPAGKALLRKLFNNRFARVARALVRLVDFGLTLLLARLRGTWIVFTAHNLDYRGTFRASVLLNRAAHRIVFALANSIHVHSREAQRVIESVYGKRRGVHVVPHGNYIGCYPDHVSRSEARRSIGIADEQYVYLSLGLLRPYKGLEDLIDAFVELDCVTARLLIAGRPLDDDYLHSLSARGQNHPNITLIPRFIPDDELQLYMNACDISVLPYKHLTTSGAALLTLSFGRPVIAPAIASFPELITAEAGILYDPAAADGLLGAMRLARTRSWQKPALLAYTRQFDWERLAPELAALYSVGRAEQAGDRGERVGESGRPA